MVPSSVPSLLHHMNCSWHNNQSRSAATMKLTSIALLLFYTERVNAQAEFGFCEDFDIVDSNDCVAECKARGRRRRWSTNQTYDSEGDLTQCECTYTTGSAPWHDGLPTEGTFTCTRESIEAPVHKIEDCPASIKTWEQCLSYCKRQSGNFHASYRGRSKEELTRCDCEYGKNRQNTYSCTRSLYLRSN